MSSYLIPLVAFMLFANPEVFKIVRGIIGSWVAGSDGVATNAGLLLHGILFVIIVGFFMRKTSTLKNRDEANDANNKHFQQNRMVN
jgi:hypothetical protein